MPVQSLATSTTLQGNSGDFVIGLVALSLLVVSFELFRVWRRSTAWRRVPRHED